MHGQFPEWAGLEIARVAHPGWDNQSFRLGADMVVRLPSAEAYVAQVRKEQEWLPILAAGLSCPVPLPLAIGAPASGYPWPWSIYRWLDGETVDPVLVAESVAFAGDVAAFLTELESIDAMGGPQPDQDNFYRGGPLSTYDAEVRESIRRLGARVDSRATIELWESAIETRWNRPPVWVHGDMSPGNLLATDGRLSGVIDFGSAAVGDPACDLSIAWTVFQGKARETFQERLHFDQATWLRARGWTLWKGLIVAAGLAETNAIEWTDPIRIIDRVL